MPTLTLVTIAPSPYCEKARWALDRAGVPYEEHAHLPLVHYAFVLPRTRGASRTVPVLATPEGRLDNSRAIVAYADRRLPAAQRLFPEDAASRAEVEALARTFDEELGPAVRRYAYCHLVERPELLDGTFTPNLSRVERALLPPLRPALVSALRRAFRPSPRAMDRLEAKLRAIFADVGTRLEGGARPYLVGSRFTAADLGFAAMSGAVLLPEAYGSPFPPLERVPARFRALVEELRDTPAGRYAQATLARHRRERVGDA